MSNGNLIVINSSVIMSKEDFLDVMQTWFDLYDHVIKKDSSVSFIPKNNITRGLLRVASVFYAVEELKGTKEESIIKNAAAMAAANDPNRLPEIREMLETVKSSLAA